MNGMKKIWMVLLCTFVVVSLAACTETDTGSADLNGTSSAVTSEPADVSSEASGEASLVPASPLPESSMVSSVSEEPSTVQEPASETVEKLQTITVGSAQFQEQFVQNEIDTQFSADFETATSGAMLGDVLYDATESWKQMVAVAYDAALESSPDETRREEVKAYYNTYMDEMQAGLAEASALAETDAIAGALATMNHYRACAAKLCNLSYENTGTMPSFDLTDVSGAAAG